MTDQYTFQDPTTQFTKAGPEFEQEQKGPGIQSEMNPIPDSGEQSYRGTGRLTGRKAVVTGADSGIGRAAAIAYAREGADVVLSYLPEEESDAQEVVKLIEAEGRKAVAVPGDVKDESYCVNLIETAVKELGGLDVLAIVAGKQQFRESIDEITTEQFDETFKTNVYAMFWLCKEAIKHMKPGSSIINTSSIQAYSPSEILLDYATTKAAINTFSKALAQQVGPKGIRVNVVAPGPVWTPLQVAGGQPPEKLPEFGEQTPLGRPGQPVEMAPAYVFLASQESSYVSGETLNANGGMVSP
ncbi:SDR family oxidoreductase [Saccharibacillus sp. CPCC 101409]|uniref:SDR family oxidoreductase n=1 Tax=Saccharibacillus sp. CPCC 101409 TaxID=3058041 RepID=UPI002671FB18|nr:SDR family oxidoreductase [Saccharibacillus sp. CPCC 101409]MDO3413038.1 SDR family oxidoreductase [Saccharibacillus sp. CPCC 101409]